MFGAVDESLQNWSFGFEQALLQHFIFENHFLNGR
jgi:hypothetical protein